MTSMNGSVNHASATEPESVTAGQVRLARFRVLRDETWGRTTPDLIRRIASVTPPNDTASA